MTTTFKPLLAGSADLLSLQFPVAATPKFDGIRCLIIDGQPVSRTLKPIRNRSVRSALEGLPAILDGEIIAKSGSFQDSTSAAMAEISEIPWEYHIFDYVSGELEVDYANRMRQLAELFELNDMPPQCKIVLPEYVYSLDHLKELCQQHLEEGYEGTMVRSPQGRYKCGRSTKREGILLKIKAFKDTEAVIVGFEELMHNENEATTNALGHTERSTHTDNKRASGMLGSFVVHPIDQPDLTYSVGTGLTQKQRIEYWQQQEQLLGKLVKVKYFEQGVKDRPRFPVFLGFRDPDDM
jgi:DNA ligase-1